MPDINSIPTVTLGSTDDRESLDDIICPLFRPSQLGTEPVEMDWLWHGYLAHGQITLLSGQWKIGKTSLLACLLARLGSGGLLAGLEVRPGRAIVLSEEGGALWHGRCKRHGIGDAVSFAFRPFAHRPPLRHWKILCENLSKLHRRRKLDLVVFDPLATLWPARDESNASSVLEALEPIRGLAQDGVAVLLLHHPRKEQSAAGCDARGSGAMTAFVDILMEMHWFTRANEADRRRRLLAWSRHEATPRELVVELNVEGTDYCLALATSADAAVGDGVRGILQATPDLTAREVLDRWPANSPRPSLQAIYGWLSQAVARRELTISGAGHRYEPYRYHLANCAITNGGGI